MLTANEIEEIKKLVDASKVIRARFDDGTFIRDVSHDHEDGWFGRSIALTRELSDWVQAIEKVEELI